MGSSVTLYENSFNRSKGGIFHISLPVSKAGREEAEDTHRDHKIALSQGPQYGEKKTKLTQAQFCVCSFNSYFPRNHWKT